MAGCEVNRLKSNLLLFAKTSSECTAAQIQIVLKVGRMGE